MEQRSFCKQIIKQNVSACSLFKYTEYVETDERLVSLSKAQGEHLAFDKFW